jgi:hypothetical protein
MNSRSSFSIRLTSIVVVALVCLLTMVGVAKRRSGVEGRASSSAEAQTTSADPEKTGERVQNVRFTIYDVGIYPQEIHVEPGVVAVAIEDRTGKSQGLVIDRDDGNGRVSVGQVQRAPDHWRGRGQVKLEPGRYRVFDKGRPNNQSTLLVEP